MLNFMKMGQTVHEKRQKGQKKVDEGFYRMIEYMCGEVDISIN